jgi:hypothetical protein
MTRAEHLAWAKERALAILDDPDQPDGSAVASMISDLGQHPELYEHPGIRLLALEALFGFYRTPADVRRAIERFN